MKVKEESENVGLKLNIQKTKIIASGPITSWQIDGGNNENSERQFLGGSKITAFQHCSHEINMLASWKKIDDHTRQHIKKQRQGLSSHNYGFSSSHVWM